MKLMPQKNTFYIFLRMKREHCRRSGKPWNQSEQRERGGARLPASFLTPAHPSSVRRRPRHVRAWLGPLFSVGRMDRSLCAVCVD